eukprot:g4204.t1
MKLREGLRNVLGVGSFPLVTFLKLTGARQLSPNVSTTVYDNGQQSPLVVLRAGSSGTDAALPRPELEIFAEDPSWTFKVEDFMVSTGADALAVEAALQEVRQISWAAGRTFRPKYLVLLAFAEDTHHHGDEQASCRLVRAVLAASKHTAFAHFVLVADGFALDASTREAMETALDEGGWRSFTSVEVPEFEGFSSAVNRAMNTILDNAVVAVLSTFIRAWREDVAGTASYRVSSEARVEHAKEEAVVDQWTRLSPADLETLAQADADLFFLQLLLSWPSPESAPHNDTVARCIAFHSEWMERSPDDELVTETLNRRTQFPVAAVVVVHDDISLMRTALEEVALVVEHILVVVSVRPWNGGAGEVEDTLEMLSSIVEDVQSPTHGKLRVEVGSWPTEQDQREYGNSVIREDPRNFSRVVAMDTDEFWHPVELANSTSMFCTANK